MRRVTTTDADRWTAALRLLAVPVIVTASGVSNVVPAHHSAWVATVGAFAGYGAATVVAMRGAERPAVLDIALPSLDILFAAAISLASLGGFVELLVLFLFPPLTSAFRLRPTATVVVTVASLGVFLVHAVPRQRLAGGGRDPDALFGHELGRALYLAWFGLALCGLSTLLARRAEVVRHLLDVRQRLVAEAIDADERARRRLAEDIHDDVLQTVLAARHDLEASAARDPAAERAHAALGDAVVRIRGLLGGLHPALIDHAGLAAALHQVARRAAEHGAEVAIDVVPDEPGRNDAVLYRVARELVGNAVAHASATRVTVDVRRAAGRDRLVVADDGRGFDPAVLEERLQAGHVGLLSIRERCEALGGAFRLETAPGRGTRVTVELPPLATAGP